MSATDGREHRGGQQATVGPADGIFLISTLIQLSPQTEEWLQRLLTFVLGRRLQTSHPARRPDGSGSKSEALLIHLAHKIQKTFFFFSPPTQIL